MFVVEPQEGQNGLRDQTEEEEDAEHPEKNPEPLNQTRRVFHKRGIDKR